LFIITSSSCLQNVDCTGIKSDDKPAIPNLPKTICQTEDNENYQHRRICSDEARFYISGRTKRLTAEYGDEKTLITFNKLKDIAQE
jgi:hypothetical protein